MKRSKITLYLILISALIFSGCISEIPYVKNNFKIKTILIKQQDSCVAVLEFRVEYYTDSLSRNYYENAMPRGDDGSDATISFIEIGKDKCDKKCIYNSLSDLSTKINNRENQYSGEFITRKKYVCLPKSNRVKVVLKNKKTGIMDTIVLR
jgi:hypothetical protein